MYTGNDGQTHFEDLHMPAEAIQNVAIQAGSDIVFRRFPADYFSDWHTAPGDSTFLFSRVRWNRHWRWHYAPFWTGDVVLADDMTGKATPPARWGPTGQCHRGGC